MRRRLPLDRRPLPRAARVCAVRLGASDLEELLPDALRADLAALEHAFAALLSGRTPGLRHPD